MSSNHPVTSLKQKLDDTFRRIDDIPPECVEARSDFARYLCVLVSGFVEKATEAAAVAYCSRGYPVPVARYAARQLARIQNLNSERLAQVVGSFDQTWRDDLVAFMEGPRKDALDSVIALRNQIAHGQSVTVTYSRIQSYYVLVKEVVAYIVELLV